METFQDILKDSGIKCELLISGITKKKKEDILQRLENGEIDKVHKILECVACFNGLKKEFLEISGYRYETLKDTLSYIQYLWDMTQNYVSSAQKQFASLKSDVTSKSVNSLTIVTSMSAGAAILGLFQKSAPTFTMFGFIYFFVLALIGWGSNKILDFISNRQKYDVTDVEYEKNIK